MTSLPETVMPQKKHEKPKARPRTKQKVAETPQILPDWPTLQPLVPTADLALETLLEDQIILIHNFFTSTLCKKYVSFLSSLPLITTPVKPKEGEAVRVNDRIQFDDPAFAEQLWSFTALKDLVTALPRNRRLELGSEDLVIVPERRTHQEAEKLWGGELCGLDPRIRVYRYGTSILSPLPPGLVY